MLPELSNLVMFLFLHVKNHPILDKNPFDTCPSHGNSSVPPHKGGKLNQAHGEGDVHWTHLSETPKSAACNGATVAAPGIPRL